MKLTDEQIDKIWKENLHRDSRARAIESEVLRLNGLTAESAEQREQAVYQAQLTQHYWRDVSYMEFVNFEGSQTSTRILYTTPPTPPAGVPDEVKK